MKKDDKPRKPHNESDNNQDPEGYPLYPENEDIYNKFKEEQDIDPEDITRTKDELSDIDIIADEDFELDEDVVELGLDGSDLDVPGSDLDDDLEEIGSEDEENNYYSLGGDNHTDLEEDEGE